MACKSSASSNADRPATIRWYKRRFGYREVGRLEKLHSFGDPNLSHWTTLQLDLLEYIGGREENDGGPSDAANPE